MGDPGFVKLISIREYDKVVFVSHYLSLGTQVRGEFEDLRFCLQQLKHISTAHFIYICSNEILSTKEQDITATYRSLEELCNYYKQYEGVNLVVVRCPYLIDPRNPNDLFFRYFHELNETGKILFDKPKEQDLNFLDPIDLASFLQRLFTDWHNENAEIDLFARKNESYGDLGSKFQDLLPGSLIEFSEESQPYTYSSNKQDIASQYYQWSPKISIVDNLDSYSHAYQSASQPHISLAKRVAHLLTTHSSILITAELLIGAWLVELLNEVVQNSSQFRLVDIRLLFIVIMSATYGIVPGILAATLMSLSLASSLAAEGTSGIMLFYDPSNWLPFIFYMMVAAIIGYLTQKREETIGFMSAEVARVSEQSSYVEGLYQDAIAARDEYRRKLTESKDGFGRIFDAVQQLSILEPQAIFKRSISVIEDILETKSVALYMIDKKESKFARLVVSSQAMKKRLRKSIRLKDYAAALSTLEDGNVWFNRDFIPDYPSYIAGVRSKGELRVLIMLYDTNFEQVSTYYMNLFRVVCGLIENFLIKAWEYESNLDKDRYINETNVLKNDWFNEKLSLAREMQDSHMASYCLIRIDVEGKTIGDIGAALSSQIRSTDAVGLGRDGNLYILAAQADISSEKIILKRCRSLGLACESVHSIKGSI